MKKLASKTKKEIDNPFWEWDKVIRSPAGVPPYDPKLYSKDISVKPFLSPAVEKALNKLSIEISKKGDLMEKAKRKVVNHPDYKARNKKSRSRGYNFEAQVRNRVNTLDGQKEWFARRLGGSSTGLPDVVITYNNSMGHLAAMECKSTMDHYTVEIPEDQVYRCVDALNVFGMYGCKTVAFGFKFLKSEKLGRKHTIERFWRLSRFDPAIDGQRGNLIKISFDCRNEYLTFHYAHEGKGILEGTAMNGLDKSFEEFIGRLKDEAIQYQELISHNENHSE